MKLRSFKKQLTKTGSSVACKKEPKNYHAEKKAPKKKKTLHTCEQCGKNFKFKSVLLKHLRIHSTERPFECRVCGAAFKQYGCLLSHNKIHAPPRFTCQECGKQFIYKKMFNLHSLRHTQTIEKSHVCSECGKRFASEERLKLHQKVHQKAYWHKKENVPFKCNICNQTFKYFKNLKVHEWIHSAEKSFSCRECWKVFSCERSLQKHLRQHAEVLKGLVEDTFSCTECKRIFQREASLIIHQCSARAEKPFKCMTCGQTFKSESNLQAHGQVHTGEKWYSCEECGEGFKRKDTLWKHEILHTGQKAYECVCCWRLFESDSALKSHMEVSNHLRAEVLEQGGHLEEVTFPKTTSKKLPIEGDKSFQCTTCGMHFSHDIKRLVHERFHSNDRDYSCIQCGKRFLCKRDLWRHLHTHTRNRKQYHSNYKCNDCGKTFTSMSSQTKHKRIHTGEMPYKCADCGKTYRWKDLLESHKRSHTGEKPYKCDHCEKRFAYYSSLSIHRKIHSAVKDFKCLKCERTFAYSFQLTRHQVIHMEEKPFSCAECGKRYWFKETLRSHKKSHSGGRRFSCTECKKTFAQKKALKVHLRLHTLVMSQRCAECGESFISEMDLHNHLKSHNGQNIFSCGKCGKSFPLKRNLYRHEKSHSLSRPFVCLVCGKNFKYKQNLSSHEKIHSRKRPFSCSDDGKSFTPMTILSSHQMVHSKDKSNKCTASKKDLDEVEHLRLDQTSSLKNPLAVHHSEKIGEMPTVAMLSASVPSIATHKVTILWLGKPDEATSKVAVPQLGRYQSGLQNRKSLGQLKHLGVKQTTSVENSLVVHQNDQTREMPAAATLATPTPNGVTHNMVITRVTKFADSISSAMKLVAVAKRTARKSYLRKLSVGTLDSSKTFGTHSVSEFPVIAIPEGIAAPPPNIPNTTSVICTPNASVNPNQETSSQPCAVSTAEMSFWCADCGMGWKDKATFTEHQRIWHVTKSQWLCLHCVETFNSKFDFENHCRIHRSDGVVIDLPAATLPAVTTHSTVLPAVTESINTAPAAGVVVVPKSEEEVPSAISDSTATLSEAIPAAVTCATCGDSFHQMSNLLDHLKTHVDNGCNVNGSINEENSPGLCRIESAERSFCCDLCMLDFKSEALFSEHLRCCPSTSVQTPYECCGKSFCAKFDFDEHCKTHIERLCLDTASVIAPSITLPSLTTSTVTMPSVTQFADSVLSENMPAAAQPASNLSPSGTVVASSPVNFFVLMVPTLSVAMSDASAVCYNPNVSGILHQETLPPPCETSLTKGAYWCVDCSMGFKYEPMLGRHRTIWHTPKKLKPCPMCGQTFNTRYENEMHRNTCTAKIMSMETPTGIAPPVVTPAANKSTVPTPARTETHRARPNVAKFGVHLCSDSPSTNVPTAVIPAANITSMTPHYVTTISATATASGTLYAANKDSLTECNDTVCPTGKPADGHSMDMPAENNSVLNMPSVTELNDTVPIMVKHADQLLEAMIAANILTETMFTEKHLSDAVHVEEMHAPTDPERRKSTETPASSSRPASGIASIIQCSATNPDTSKLVANTSASTKPVLKVLADPTFIVGMSGTDEPVVTACTTTTVNMSRTTKTPLTSSEVTLSAANKPVSMESADSTLIQRSPTADKLMADSALTTGKATNSTVTIPTVTKPTSMKLTLAEIGANMLIQGNHAVVMPDVSKPDLNKPNMMRPASLGPNDLIPNVPLPTGMLCEDMPAVTMPEATRPAAIQCDATLLIGGNTTVCQSTLITPSTATSSITSATSTFVASSHTVMRPALPTSDVSKHAVKELDDRTLNEGKTSAGKPVTTTTTATSPVAAMPYAVTPVTVAQHRNGLDQKATLVLRWRIHPAMGPQLHEGASAPANDSIGCPKNLSH